MAIHARVSTTSRRTQSSSDSARMLILTCGPHTERRTLKAAAKKRIIGRAAATATRGASRQPSKAQTAHGPATKQKEGQSVIHDDGWTHNPAEDEIEARRAAAVEERRRLCPLAGEFSHGGDSTMDPPLDPGKSWTAAPKPPPFAEGCAFPHGPPQHIRTFEEEGAIKATLIAEEEERTAAFRRAWGAPWQLWVTFLVFLIAFDIVLAWSLRGTYGYRSVSALWLWWPLLISTIASGWLSIAVYGVARQWGWPGMVRCAAGAALCCLLGAVGVYFGWWRW